MRSPYRMLSKDFVLSNVCIRTFIKITKVLPTVRVILSVKAVNLEVVYSFRLIKQSSKDLQDTFSRASYRYIKLSMQVYVQILLPQNKFLFVFYTVIIFCINILRF